MKRLIIERNPPISVLSVIASLPLSLTEELKTDGTETNKEKGEESEGDDDREENISRKELDSAP